MTGKVKTTAEVRALTWLPGLEKEGRKNYRELYEEEQVSWSSR